ncbi:hypothetical protein [Mesorhizobium sp. ES1-3]|uniref:hypothetical protein n=1 Tax=Mesorhizobium sp. ES1-3 TaxID=2876628 RepID=UPI001CCBDB9E|nr:hypothetical protein [Mesorhizobium sp. ES1-3]MBZ9673185.1 hypothetical protein [Mesorhizobium sp. ES1-3]
MVGRWRIVEADLWDRDHPDLVDPATITVEAGNHGEIAFRPASWRRSQLWPQYGILHMGRLRQMDEVTGEALAELLDDGSIEITFAYHNGDEAILKAKRDISSTAR